MCCQDIMDTCVYLICIAVASFAVLAQPAVAQGTNTTLPLTYSGQILQGDGSQTCHSEEQRERVRNEVDIATLRLLRESVVPLLQTQLPTEPSTQPSTQPSNQPSTQPSTHSSSTQSLSQPSTLPTTTTQPPTVTGFSCGGSTGWRRVAYLNMSGSSQQCPSVWREYTTPHRVCGRMSTTGSCEGLNYSTGSEQYNQVCGRIIGYQIGLPDSFYRSSGSTVSIDTFYVDGVSVTHGSPRQHIWTFSTGLDEGIRTSSTCFCVTGSSDRSYIPSFVGQNYFCETGLTLWNNTGGLGVFWPDGDPLWDGQGCGSTSITCCTFNSPPWFNAQLSSPTTDDIEVRICGDQGIGDEDSPIQLMELYVK